MTTWKDFRCSWFANALSVDPEQMTIAECLRGIRDGRWEDDITRVREIHTQTGGGDEYGKAKRDLPAFCIQASMKTRSKKSKDRGIELNGLVQMDIDHIDDAEGARDAIFKLPWVGAAWVSPSGEGVKAIAKATDNLAGSHRRLTELMAAEGWTLDQSTKDNVRLCFVSHDPELRVRSPDKVALVSGIPDKEAKEEKKGRLDEVNATGTKDYSEDIEWFEAMISEAEGALEGERNSTGYALALKGRDQGLSVPVVFRGLMAWNEEKNAHPLSHREVVDVVNNAFHYAEGAAGAESVGALPEPEGGEEDLEREIASLVAAAKITDEYDASKRVGQVTECGVATDLDASAAFVAEHIGRLRYNAKLGWLSWNGRHWEVGGNAKLEAREFSKRAARRRLLDAMNMEDGEDREEAVKKAVVLESATKIAAVLELSASDPRMLISEYSLDADPWLLCVENGTLDTRTMELKPHDPADLITKMAKAMWRGLGFRCPLFDRYLESLPGDMLCFLPRAFGASLVADCTTDALFLLQGPGGAGKSTLAKAFHRMMGTYAVKLRVEAVCATRSSSQDSASPSLLRMRGSRFCFVSESNKSAKLDSGRLKEWSGGEPVSARGLHKDPIEFETTWKLWIVSNFDPQCDADDSGFWRRLVKIGFPVIKNPDPLLRDALADDPDAQSAILSWAARGCVEWVNDGRGRAGLGVPESVDATSHKYRESQDHMSSWFSDLTQSGGWREDPTAFIANTLLRANYETWAREEGETPWGPRRWRTWLTETGMTQGRSTVNGTQIRGWFGVGMMPNAQEGDEEL